jgi:hypothetical protein
MQDLNSTRSEETTAPKIWSTVSAPKSFVPFADPMARHIPILASSNAINHIKAVRTKREEKLSTGLKLLFPRSRNCSSRKLHKNEDLAPVHTEGCLLTFAHFADESFILTVQFSSMNFFFHFSKLDEFCSCQFNSVQINFLFIFQNWTNFFRLSSIQFRWIFDLLCKTSVRKSFTRSPTCTSLQTSSRNKHLREYFGRNI